jgi:4-hydroxy-tetrahydrodipicolinate synthase
MPLTEHGSPDLAALRQTVARLAGYGVGTITVNGNVGEYASLTTVERRMAVHGAVDAAADVPVIAAVGGDLPTACQDARDAAGAGAKLIMIHQPSHPFRSIEGWGAYHAAIARAVPDLGVVLYLRDPAVDQVAFESLAADAPNVLGAKYALPDPVTLAELTGTDRLPWTWLCGLAERWAPFFWLAGARGFTSGLANVEPSVPLALLAALNSRDAERIGALMQAVAPFEALRTKRAGAANVAVVKAAMHQRGRLACTHVRPPLTPLPERDEPALREALDRLEPWITPPLPR